MTFMPAQIISWDDFKANDSKRLVLPKERVVTVTIGEAEAAFPFSILVEEGTFKYNVGGTDLAVFFKLGTRSGLDSGNIADSNKIEPAALFEANLDGTKHTFENDGDRTVDEETGSVSSILGEAIESPLAGKNLTPVVHTNLFWFAVVAFKPGTKIY